MSDLDVFRAEIAACRVCSPFLAAGPRPVVQFSATARVLIIGQAPGSACMRAACRGSRTIARDRLRRMDGDPAGHLLRSAPGRPRAHGLLLSRQGREW